MSRPDTSVTCGKVSKRSNTRKQCISPISHCPPGVFCLCVDSLSLGLFGTRPLHVVGLLGDLETVPRHQLSVTTALTSSVASKLVTAKLSEDGVTPQVFICSIVLKELSLVTKTFK
eukprot:5676882-Amphidinium_carterae.1